MMAKKAEFQFTVTRKHIDQFSRLTGDTNPLHTNTRFAQKHNFSGPIVHGMLAAALFSTLLGKHLPSAPYLYLSQKTIFHKEILVGDTITIQGVITHESSVGIITIATKIFTPSGSVAVSGTARGKKLIT